MLGGKSFLCLRSTVIILEAFYVSGKDRLIPDGPDKSKKVHHDAGLITVRIGYYHPCPVCIHLQDRTYRCINFSIHQNNMVIVSNGSQGNLCSEFNIPGSLDDCL